MISNLGRLPAGFGVCFTMGGVVNMFLVVLLVISSGDQSLADPPTFTNNGLQVVKINEYHSTGKKLADVQCTDGDNDDTTISIGSIVPSGGACSNCFSTIPASGYKTYSLQFLPQGSLSYQVNPKFEIRLNCTDENGEKAVDQYVVEVRVIPNTSPDLPTTPVGVVNDTKTKRSGDPLYDVGCTDANDDPLTYTLKALAHAEYFEIDSEGVIRASKDLRTLCYDVVNFEVTCKDQTNPTVGPVRKQLKLNGANKQPEITGLGGITDVSEDRPVGFAVVNFTVIDDDPPNCKMTVEPAVSSYFELGPPQGDQVSIVVRNPLDYERDEARESTVTVTCTDTSCTSDPVVMTIRVTDANDPVQLNPSTVRVTEDEGSISIARPWTVVDDDVDDAPTYKIVNDSSGGEFTVDPSSGTVTSTQEYDVDAPDYKPATVVLEIEAKDKGSSSTVTMILTIRDINDNAPTFAGSPLTFRDVSACTPNGNTIGTLNASDADRSYKDNNVLSYSGEDSGVPFDLLSSGEIIVSSTLTAGRVYTIPSVIATDKGPERLSSRPETVRIVVVNCPAGSTPATAPPTTTTAAPPTTTAATAATTDLTNATATGNGTGTGVTTGTGSGVPPGSGNDNLNLTLPNAAGDFMEHNFHWIVAGSVLGGVFLLATGVMVVKVCYRKKGSGDLAPRRHSPGAVRPEEKRIDRARYPQKRYPDYYERNGVSPSAISYHDVGPPRKNPSYDPWRERGLPS